MRGRRIKRGLTRREEDLIMGAVLLTLGVLLLSLIPLLRLGSSARAALDDYVYGAPVHYALEAGGGLFSVLRAILENVLYTYADWQGTYSSVILFSIEPGAFQESWYGLTTWVMLFAILCPIFLALGAVKDMERWGRLIIGAVVAFLSIQYLPSPAQGFYWWNGAAHYILFWLFSVWAVVHQVRLSRWEGTEKGFWRKALLGMLLAFWVGGGNFCTALVFPLVSGLLWVLAMRDKRSWQVAAANLLMTAAGAAGLFISMAAPGNALRQAGFQPMNPVLAILTSFARAGRTLWGAAGWQLLGALLLTVPVFLLSTRSCSYSFDHPILVTLGSFCAYSALFTPPIYSMGEAGLLGRLENLFWLAGLFLIFGVAFYLAGWAARQWLEPGWDRSRKSLWAVFMVGAVALTVGFLLQLPRANSARAAADLRSQARITYLEEREARRQVLADPEAGPERFRRFTGGPECFFLTRVSTWQADLQVDGKFAELPIYRGRGGGVTYVELGEAMTFFGVTNLEEGGFSQSFYLRGGRYVSLREFCDQAGYLITYDFPIDTIRIRTNREG